MKTAMPELRFEPENHVYSLWGDGFDGLVIPSITQVIQLNDMYGYARNASSIAKMSHGTKVHLHTEWLDRDMIDVVDVTEETPEILAYHKFKQEMSFNPVLIEHKMHHPQYLYAGTIDRFGEITIAGATLWAVVEIKTGQYHPAVELQLAAQKELVTKMVPDSQIDKCLALYLTPDGEYRLHEAEDLSRSWNTFLCALTVLRWKEANKIIRRR